MQKSEGRKIGGGRAFEKDTLFLLSGQETKSFTLTESSSEKEKTHHHRKRVQTKEKTGRQAERFQGEERKKMPILGGLPDPEQNRRNYLILCSFVS